MMMANKLVRVTQMFRVLLLKGNKNNLKHYLKIIFEFLDLTIRISDITKPGIRIGIL